MMSKEPIISVCCLAFNHEDFIHDCLEGILKQKLNVPFEILVHDDASTDSTPKIIEEYALKHPDVIRPIYQEENMYSRGVKINYTINFPRARGKYIAICECDDFFTKNNHLQNLYDYLENTPDASMAFTSATIFEGKKNTKTVRNNYNDNKNFDFKTILKVGGGFYPSCGMMFRKKYFDQSPYWLRYHKAGDYAIALWLALNGDVKFIDGNSCAYRKHDGGVSSVKYRKKQNAESFFNNELNMSIHLFDALLNEKYITHNTHEYLTSRELYRGCARLFDDKEFYLAMKATFKLWPRSKSFVMRLIARQLLGMLRLA